MIICSLSPLKIWELELLHQANVWWNWMFKSTTILKLMSTCQSPNVSLKSHNPDVKNADDYFNWHLHFPYVIYMPSQGLFFCLKSKTWLLILNCCADENLIPINTNEQWIVNQFPRRFQLSICQHSCQITPFTCMRHLSLKDCFRLLMSFIIAQPARCANLMSHFFFEKLMNYGGSKQTEFFAEELLNDNLNRQCFLRGQPCSE